MKHLLLLCVFIALNFTACAENSTPKCDDKVAQKLLAKEIKSYAQLGVGFMGLLLGESKAAMNEIDKNMQIDFDAFTTIAVDKLSKIVACKAKARLSIGSVPFIDDFINYTVQAADNGQIYVQIKE